MEFDTNKYIPGTCYLVDYCIEHFGAEVISVEEIPEKKPPFPCLTGASNTSNSYKIASELYPNIATPRLGQWKIYKYLREQIPQLV